MSGDPSEKVSENFKLSPDFSPKDYEKNWSDQLLDIEDSDERNKVFDTFYKHIWNLLFGPKATKETQEKAVALLVVERPDAAFLNPFVYNDWIRTVKQEIIKREMSDLWQNAFKKKELGLIWARDSDYFDDMDDPEPAQFYKLKESDPDIQWSN